MNTASLTHLPVELRDGAKPAFWQPVRIVGAVILLALLAFAFVGPLVIGADPLFQDYLAVLVAPGDPAHWLGTDHFGRSMAARLVHGAQLSFVMAFVTALSAAVPGIALGILAASRGGWVERGLVALSDIVLALPGLLLVLLLMAFAPGKFGPLYLGLALYLWVEFFRVARIETARVLALPCCEATRLLGFGPFYVFGRIVLPALAGPMMTLFAFAMGSAIIAVSTLSAIHVGLRPPTPELGAMIVELMPYYSEAPLQVLMPAGVIFLLVLSLQLLAGRKS
ncbi:ABC transporter permease [Thalassospira sp. HJ]|uniref:ABC transporter permease n=1 Tax=Thalassospira sp. HJ TaxID=1616823 RepID=UPI0005DBCE17|nr:ABC transporter permease [Thalassospira sp. HJ]KJE34348.1 ABC transporter permease [Thalassospira sp. HJ]